MHHWLQTMMMMIVAAVRERHQASSCAARRKKQHQQSRCLSLQQLLLLLLYSRLRQHMDSHKMMQTLELAGREQVLLLLVLLARQPKRRDCRTDCCSLWKPQKVLLLLQEHTDFHMATVLLPQQPGHCCCCCCCWEQEQLHRDFRTDWAPQLRCLQPHMDYHMEKGVQQQPLASERSDRGRQPWAEAQGYWTQCSALLRPGQHRREQGRRDWRMSFGTSCCFQTCARECVCVRLLVTYFFVLFRFKHFCFSVHLRMKKTMQLHFKPMTN